jgi:cytochrome c biogenesis protein CcmG/thiol:disulfide interchange protein DsbE
VAYTANRRTARVWLGAEDLLPRQFVHYVGAGNEKSQYNASIIVEFRDMERNPAISLADVTVEAPAGFETEQLVIAERPSAEDRKEIGIRPRSVSGAPGETPAPATRREALEAAPDFSLQATDGSTVTLADLRGSIVVLDFWGTWALQSKQSAPEIQALHEKFKDRGVRFVGIAVKERNEEKAAKTFEERGQTYTLVTKGDSAASAYGVSTFPTIVVIGPSGEILNKVQKYVPGESIKLIEGTIERHLSPTAPASGG